MKNKFNQYCSLNFIIETLDENPDKLTGAEIRQAILDKLNERSDEELKSTIEVFETTEQN